MITIKHSSRTLTSAGSCIETNESSSDSSVDVHNAASWFEIAQID